MAMQSFGECPWCGARIELRRTGGTIECPVCGCKFERSRAKWQIGVPAALIAAAPVWAFVPWHGRLLAALVAIVVLIGTALFSSPRILAHGRTDIAAGAAKGHRAIRSRESMWFLLLLGVLIVASLIFVGVSFLSTR